jgi:surface protein with Ig-like domain
MIKNFTLIITLIISVLLYSGCKKPDYVPPVITLQGANPLTLTLNSPYVEPGYSALDNKDGDITSKVRTSWTPAFNQNLSGTYVCAYVVNDAAGNLDTARRTVYVVNSAFFLSGDYPNLIESCYYTGPLSFESMVIASSTVNNNFTIGNFGGLGVNLNANFYPSGDSVSIPAGQPLGGPKTLSWSSVVITSNSNPTSWNVYYKWTDGHNTDSCSFSYYK